jgi:hypothetical protein
VAEVVWVIRVGFVIVVVGPARLVDEVDGGGGLLSGVVFGFARIDLGVCGRDVGLVLGGEVECVCRV